MVNRVFHLKLRRLMAGIDGGLFGAVATGAYVVEFQKRGLPHAHILVILAPASRVNCPEDIDSIISAELPDAASHHEWHQHVATNMIHGPCGDLKPSSPAWRKNYAPKNIPRYLLRIRFTILMVCQDTEEE